MYNSTSSTRSCRFCEGADLSEYPKHYRDTSQVICILLYTARTHESLPSRRHIYTLFVFPCIIKNVLSKIEPEVFVMYLHRVRLDSK